MNGLIPGVRVWLSGSVPDDADAQLRERILQFVELLAKAVFREGGTLIHGSHPSIRDTLLSAAERYREATGDKASLVLTVSRLFSKTPSENGIDMERWKSLCQEVRETPEALADRGTDSDRKRSLDLMRDAMAGQCDVIIAIGGRWWDVALHRVGVLDELTVAVERGLPCFLLQGFGGAARGFLSSHPELLRKCCNGLSDSENLELASLEDPQEIVNRVVAQIGRLPLRRRDVSGTKSFRILSLDGGGIKGAFTAAVLAHWENATGRSVAQHFDLIAGTSTGGILAIGLGLGMSAQAMLEFYKRDGGVIFPSDTQMTRLRHWLLHWVDAKFDPTVLQAKLEQAYGEAPRGRESLANSICRLFIPSYNAKGDVLYPFRTPHPPFELVHDEKDPVRVALATSAAPTYFKPAEARGSVDTVQALDGGVWANCPGPAALAEVSAHLRIPLDRVEMLSIGTTYSVGLEGTPRLGQTQVAWVVNKFRGWFSGDEEEMNGKLGWAANIAAFLMKTQCQTAEYLCASLLGDRFVRVDAAAAAEGLDDVRAVPELVAIGEQEARRHLTKVTTRFLNGVPADPWRAEL